MLKRQLALWLKTETDEEAEQVWRRLPSSSRHELAEHHARLIGRAAKLAASTKEREADDERAPD